jgi:predicted esterase
VRKLIGSYVLLVAALASVAACRPSRADPISHDTSAQRSDGEDLKLVEHTTAIAYQHTFRDEDLEAWHKRVPPVEVIAIRSSADGALQRAVWYDSGSRQPKPLLVVLHSWSADYEQNLDIPFAELAIANDWAFMHPDFRGPNRRPQATASDLAVRDVLDAVTYAEKHAAIDRARIYLVGYSGGAMKALVLAGKHPELWGGVAAWGPIYDIADWYRHDHADKTSYRREIAASCGGVPRPGSAAEARCQRRSPMSYLERAAGRVPVLIAHGMNDHTVPPRHALLAFDALAAADDRFTEAQRRFIDARGRLPPELQQSGTADALFDRAGAPIRLYRRSRAVTLVLYKGGHDMIYNPALRWLAQQRRPWSVSAR